MKFVPHRERAHLQLALLIAMIAIVASAGCVRLRDSDERGADAGAVARAQLVAPTETPTPSTAAVPTATSVPASATSAPPPTATSAPATATTVPATATSAPPTATSAPASTTPSASTSTSGDATVADVVIAAPESGGGPHNIANLRNMVDGRLRVKGRVQVNQIMGDVVAPQNESRAYASCVGCSTLTVALQLNVVPRTATTVTPKNVAIALNYQCSGCRTYAVALQYVKQVDDPRLIPDNVNALARQMNAELRAIQTDQSVTLPDAITRVNAVVAQFQDLAASLNDQRDDRAEVTSPGATAP